MTRKDYVIIAAALAQSSTAYGDHEIGYAAWCAARDAVADALKQDNPRFDRDRFLAACAA
jgi:hypothetical protein